MKRLWGRRAGFTLVELLVVIAIITVLIAIALPVFSRAREKARQTACMANLHQLAMAVRMYRMDMGLYPGPYDPVTGMGGLNDLYPAYVSSRTVFICPDDLTESGEQYINQKVLIYYSPAPPDDPPTYADLLRTASTIYTDQDPSGEYWLRKWENRDPNDPEFFTNTYSSYNGMYNWVGYVGQDSNYSLLGLGEQYLHKGDNLAFWYAWYRWDPDNDLEVWSSSNAYDFVNSQLHYHLTQQTYWSDYNPWDIDQQQFRLLDGLRRALWDPGNPDESAYDYMPYGMPSPVFPGLINRNAPDSTIITRCIHHRPYTVERIRTSTGPPAGRGGPGNRGGPGGPPSFETEITFSESPKDIVLRLDGTAGFVIGLNYDWAAQPQSTQ